MSNHPCHIIKQFFESICTTEFVSENRLMNKCQCCYVLDYIFLISMETQNFEPLPPSICIIAHFDLYLSFLRIYLHKFYFRHTNFEMESVKERDNERGQPMLDDQNFELWYEVLMRGLLRDLEMFTWFTVQPFTAPDFETEPYEHFNAVDADGVHISTVIPKWRGESGKIKWQRLLRFNEDRRLNWGKNLSDIVTRIARHVREDLWDRVKLTAEYTEGMNDRPIGVKKILAAVKKIATGHGAHSLYLDLTRLFDCKMKDGQWVPYFKEFRSARSRIKSRTESEAEILEAIYDTIFVMGVINQPILKDQIAKILSMTKWPTADINMAEWSITLETIQGMKKGSNHDGKLIANATKMSTGSPRPRAPPPHRKTRSRSQGHQARRAAEDRYLLGVRKSWTPCR